MNMRQPIRPAIALGWAALGVLAGCSAPAPPPAAPGGTGAAATGQGPRLVFITNSNADWWNALEKGMTDGGQEFGCPVEMRRNDGNVKPQIDKLREVLSLKDVKGVAVSILEADAPGIQDAMAELQEAGIVVITIDSDVADDAAEVRRAYIGTNNEKAGEIAGKAAAAVRPQGGTVDVFVGNPAAANARQRSDGFFRGAGAAFKKGTTWEDSNDFAKNQTNVETALSKNPDLGVVLGLWSYNAPIIADVVSKSPEVREKLSVVTFDLAEAAVDHLENGEIDVSVCQNPYEIGYQAVKLLKALVEKDETTIAEVLPDDKSREIDVRVIVPNAESPASRLEADVMTIDEMKTWLASKGLKSS